MLTKKRLPFLIIIICCIEILIYLWAIWTATIDKSNFFGIEPEYIFDKCARISGRISSIIILITLFSVGYWDLKKIYRDERKKEFFLILITLFTCNHLMHLLYVILRFRSHGEAIILDTPLKIGGTIHGIITFTSIVIIPFILWNFKHLSNLLYLIIIFYLFNICSFIAKTFLDKIKLPEHPAYHNQLGIVLISVAFIYILLRVCKENIRNIQKK